MDHSLPGSSAHGILQTRILERVTIPFSRGSPQARGWIHNSWVSCICSRVLYHSWKSSITAESGFLKEEIVRRCWVLQRGEKKSPTHGFKCFQGTTICFLLRSNLTARVAVGEGSPHGKMTWLLALIFNPSDFTCYLGFSPWMQCQ